MASKRVPIFLVAAVVLLGAVFQVSAESISREYVIRQAGVEIGTTAVEISQAGDQTKLSTAVVYPQMGLEIDSEYFFSGSDFPKQPVSYSFSIKSGGILDLEMEWADTAKYTIKQLGQTVELPDANVLALDNYVVSDYMTATWIYGQTDAAPLASSLIVPVTLAQGSQIVPMAISYVGQETVGTYTADHFQVNLGVVVDLWVDQSDRSLLKLQIPMQAFEIEAVDLGAAPEPPRIFDDFGGYGFRDLDFHINVDRAKLSGTMTVPEVSGERPGVVLVAGSGPTDRDGNSFVMPGPADYLKEIAHYLASRGVIVVRYDKRGVGESPGEIQSFNDYINDVDAVVDLLGNLSNVADVFIVGHSEGAWLASEVARKRDDLAGVVLLAGAGYPYFDTVKRQIAAQCDAGAAVGLFDFEVKERTMKALDDLYQAVLNDTDYSLAAYELPAEIEQLMLPFVGQRFILKEWFTADPAQVLSEIKVPVLIMQGTADLQVQTADAYALADALPEEQRDLYIFDGLDHVLKMTYGEPLSYTDPERRVDRKLLSILGDWILTKSGVEITDYRLPY